MGLTEERKERYKRQIGFPGLGERGQEMLAAATVTVIGVGGLGGIMSEELVRAGVGHLRLVDSDRVSISNLQRQFLYEEADLEDEREKVLIAAERLRKIDPAVIIEPFPERLKEENLEKILAGSDLVLDATDNWETRYRINRFCVKHRIPWIYGGVKDARGMTFNILPEGPCLCCLSGQTGEDEKPGEQVQEAPAVIGPGPAVTASIQVMEALKILTGSDRVRRTMVMFDLWENEFAEIPVRKSDRCPVCGKREENHD